MKVVGLASLLAGYVNMRLTKEQVEQMQAKGMDLDTIRREAEFRGDKMPDTRDLLQKTGDVVNAIFPGKQVGRAIGTLGGLGISKLQGTSKFYDTSAPTPLQVAGDVAQGALSVAGAKIPMAGTVLGKGLQFGALGAGAGAASAISEGKSTEEIGKQALRGGIGGFLVGTTFGVLEKGIQKLGKGTEYLGKKIQTKVINPHKVDLQDGFKVETLQKYDLGGSLQDTLKKTDTQLTRLTKELNTKLGQSNTAVDLNKTFEKTIERLSTDKLKNFGTQKQVQVALEQLRNEIVEAAGKNGLMSVPEAQVVKQAAGHMGAWQYGSQTPDAKAVERVYNAFYSALKESVEEASPAGVREVNKQISELIPVMNAVVRQIPAEARRSPISMSDLITLGFATFEPRALTLTGLNIASKSGKVGSALVNVGQKITGSAINKTGQAVRFLQTLGN